MEKKICLKVESLSRHFGPVKAVNDISFEVQKGEILGFLGPNGAGKSTTMQMLSGNLAPSQGQISINGVDLLDQPRQAKTFIGYLPEQPPLYKEFTVREYLQFCARLNRLNKTQIPAAIDRVLDKLSLKDVQRRLIANLSKGYQQRVAIAQAIIHEPLIVILDEPTVGLDPNQIQDVRRLISDFAADHCVILSTHILPEVQAICDRVQIINKGKLILQEEVSRLDSHLSNRTLLVGFASQRHISDFSNIPHIKSVERLDDQRFLIRHAPEHNPAQDVVRLSVEKNWLLTELTPQSQSLETLFTRLTSEAEPGEIIAAEVKQA